MSKTLYARISDGLYQRVLEVSESYNINISNMISDALQDYVDKQQNRSNLINLRSIITYLMKLHDKSCPTENKYFKDKGIN